jgi:hypothetical protein
MAIVGQDARNHAHETGGSIDPQRFAEHVDSLAAGYALLASRSL